MLRYAGVGAGAMGMATLIAACGVNASPSGVTQTTPPGFWDAQTLHHVPDFANRPYYIDTHQGDRPSLDLFKKKYGITVNYRPLINDNQAFFAKIQRSCRRASRPAGT
ncbi:MAG: hypothetical protein ACXVWF_06850 [Actinomycetota bacterium]